MASRAMIVVAGGSATRFGGEKLMAEVAGEPLISHTVASVSGSADITVVVTRPDIVEPMTRLGLDAVITQGGRTRTDSELAGLAALGKEYDLIGIHDAARPLVSPDLVERLFQRADEVGGAVPTLEPTQFLVDRRRLAPVNDLVTVQTPQVFRGPELFAAYVHAARTGFEGHDTVDVVERFGDLDIAAVAGDPGNVKVTFQADLDVVRSRLEGSSRSAPR